MRRGFTLVELLIVFGIFTILFLIVGSLSFRTLPKTQLRVEADAVEQQLRRAQTRTIAGDQNAQWGVYLTSSSATLFAGSSYATRTTALDQVHTFQDGIEASGLSEVVFSFRTGETTDTGTVTLTASATGETAQISVNAAGLITQ